MYDSLCVTSQKKQRRAHFESDDEEEEVGGGGRDAGRRMEEARNSEISQVCFSLIVYIHLWTIVFMYICVYTGVWWR